MTDQSSEDRRERTFAASMGASIDLAQYLVELVADMWALGSTPEPVVDLLRPLGLPPETTRMLGLGCGKAALGITVAAELGFKIVGVDLRDSFLEEAKRRAAMKEVANLCEFEHGDLRDKLAEAVSSMWQRLRHSVECSARSTPVWLA